VTAAGFEAAFDGTASTDNDRIVSYAWDFGDGTAGTGAQPAHTYETLGAYDAALTVTDTAGNSATATARVTVYDPSQVGMLEVRVLDDTSGAPIPGASVAVQPYGGEPLKYLADAQGLVRLIQVPGNYHISAYKSDYKPKAVDAALTGGGISPSPCACPGSNWSWAN